MLGIYTALIRGATQIARAYGDELRVALLLSSVLEIFSGMLIDAPTGFLGIQGDLAYAGPIQAIFDMRNQHVVVALVTLGTFESQWRSRSVRGAVSRVADARGDDTSAHSLTDLVRFVADSRGRLRRPNQQPSYLARAEARCTDRPARYNDFDRRSRVGGLQFYHRCLEREQRT